MSELGARGGWIGGKWHLESQQTTKRSVEYGEETAQRSTEEAGNELNQDYFSI